MSRSSGFMWAPKVYILHMKQKIGNDSTTKTLLPPSSTRLSPINNWVIRKVLCSPAIKQKSYFKVDLLSLVVQPFFFKENLLRSLQVLYIVLLFSFINVPSHRCAPSTHAPEAQLHPSVQ